MKLVTFFRVVLSVVIFFGCSSTVAYAGIECQKDNAALQSMPLIDVTFTRKDGSTFEIESRLANNNQTRAAGFQYVCKQTIAAKPILFVFEQARMVNFHMHNVVAGIDIAFIRPDSSIDSIQKMHPYVLIQIDKPLYNSKGAVIAAFEAYPDFFKVNNIDLEGTVSWQLEDN